MPMLTSLRFSFSLLICLCLWSLSPSLLFANYTSALEQQINLIDGEYVTATGTADPSDNSLGLALWDSSRYTGATVYFEAILACVSCSGGNAQATAQLYSQAGAAVTGATTSTGNATYTKVRSASAITAALTDETNYTVRLTRDASSGTAYIQAARLIVIQSGTNITTSQTQIEIGNTDTSTSTSYELITGPKVYLYDADVYSAVQNIYFEASLVSSGASGTAYAALSSSSTCASTVSGSEVSVTGTTWDLNRSGDIEANLSDNTEYWVCLKTSATDTTSISLAKVVIDQADAQGIYLLQPMHLMVNTEVTDTDASYTNQLFPIEFDPDNYVADVRAFYFDTTFSASGGDAYARLFNTSDASAVTDSERTTSSTAYIRSRSSDLTATMPTATKDLDTQLRNSATNTTFASASYLVIQLTRILDPALTFTISGVGANTVNNGITTSVATDYNLLDFDHLTPLVPKYAAHQLYVASNAPSGYTVTMRLLDYLQGLYPSNNIDPFTASWSSPMYWSGPTGTTPNDNTGWFGANTSDTRVSGWSDALEKFGPVNSSAQTVMTATSADAGTTVYVTYALEVNLLQPADQYTGSLIYNLLPLY